MQDPRPLTTEPLAIDLVNTEWIDAGERRDLLAEPGGLATWLATAGHAGAPADAEALAALRDARAAIGAAIARRDDAASLNAVLARGHLAKRLGPDGPERDLEVDDERWRVPWLAAQNLLELLRAGADRIRGCAADGCILHFYDVSRPGGRQWCSMASCGNRAKARRHYRRTRGAV